MMMTLMALVIAVVVLMMIKNGVVVTDCGDDNEDGNINYVA